MFKDIFPDKLNRFVYKKGGPQETFGGKDWERDEEGTPLGRYTKNKKGKKVWQAYLGGKKGYDALKKQHKAGLEAEKAVKKQKKKPSSVEDLQKEADALIGSIDDFTKQIQANLDASGGEGKANKIDLNNPQSYQHHKNDFTRTEVWDTLTRLTEARKVLENRKGSNDKQRVGLEYARILLDSAKAFYKEALFHKDILRRPSADAKLKTVARARPEAEVKAEQAAALAAAKEVKEASSWVKMAKLVEEYIYIGKKTARNPKYRETARDRKRKDQIQEELKNIADSTLVVKGKKKMAMKSPDGKLVITRAEGPGSSAFMFDIDLTQKVRRGSVVRYRERMFAGGSAKDFPKRQKLTSGPAFTKKRAPKKKI